MASYFVAHKKTKHFEGGYANVQGDKGGETYKGIARKIWPNWRGWKLIDNYKKTHSLKRGDIIPLPELDILVDEFYIENFWNKIKGDKINNQEISNQLYDDAVNTGVGSAIKKLQNVLFNQNGTAPTTVEGWKNQFGVAYGVMDNITLNKLNNL